MTVSEKYNERSSLDSKGAVGSIKRICGPFQLKALRNFTPLTRFQAGPTDKNKSYL